MNIDILIHRLFEGISMPQHAHAGDGGVDLQSRVNITVEPGERVLIPTGLAIAIPAGFVGLVHPRSGLALQHGFTILNAPGTIDAGYRGEISVIGINTDRSLPFEITSGDRIAQLLFAPVPNVVFHEVSELPGTHRGAAGFGSSGGFGPRQSHDRIEP